MQDASWYLFALLMAVAIVELIVSTRWVPAYYRNGMPIFRARRLIRGIAPGAEEKLESAFRSQATLPLLFRRLSPFEIAFRERAWGFTWFSYTPIMHGLIQYVPEEGVAVVTGRLNWFPIVFVGLFVLIMRSSGENFRFFVAFLVAILASIYAIQAYRYRKVADSLNVDTTSASMFRAGI